MSRWLWRCLMCRNWASSSSTPPVLACTAKQTLSHSAWTLMLIIRATYTLPRNGWMKYSAPTTAKDSRCQRLDCGSSPSTGPGEGPIWLSINLQRLSYSESHCPCSLLGKNVLNSNILSLFSRSGRSHRNWKLQDVFQLNSLHVSRSICIIICHTRKN